jgi:DNA mismatch repair protein MutS
MVEYLHDLGERGVRTLFATHYHELVDLAKSKSRVKNFNVAVKEWKGRIIFLRKMVPGGTSRSYGLAVARLAGLPSELLARAADVLQTLEKEEVDLSSLPGSLSPKSGPTTDRGQLSLFGNGNDRLTSEVEKLEPDRMTPLEALNKLVELKRIIE